MSAEVMMELIDFCLYCNCFGDEHELNPKFIERIHRIEYGRRNLKRQVEEIAPYYREDPELTVFSVLDCEPFYDYPEYDPLEDIVNPKTETINIKPNPTLKVYQ
jgi:hypothetical protein